LLQQRLSISTKVKNEFQQVSISAEPRYGRNKGAHIPHPSVAFHAGASLPSTILVPEQLGLPKSALNIGLLKGSNLDKARS
jgi:hypothetical protein